jgi:hypothetical protein
VSPSGSHPNTHKQKQKKGYIGPLPADFVSDKFTLKFAPIAVAKGAAQVDGVLATSQVCAAPANPKIVKAKAMMA